MMIETKYDIGDTVYLMNNNKVTVAEVVSIDIEAYYNSEPDIRYSIEFGCSRILEKENLLFPNKKELIKSL